MVNEKDFIPELFLQVSGKVMAPVLITKLSEDELPGVQLVVTSSNGIVYAFDGMSGILHFFEYYSHGTLKQNICRLCRHLGHWGGQLQYGTSR